MKNTRGSQLSQQKEPAYQTLPQPAQHNLMATGRVDLYNCWSLLPMGPNGFRFTFRSTLPDYSRSENCPLRMQLSTRTLSVIWFSSCGEELMKETQMLTKEAPKIITKGVFSRGEELVTAIQMLTEEASKHQTSLLVWRRIDDCDSNTHRRRTKNYHQTSLLVWRRIDDCDSNAHKKKHQNIQFRSCGEELMTATQTLTEET